jgi:hypothetical protein
MRRASRVVDDAANYVQGLGGRCKNYADDRTGDMVDIDPLYAVTDAALLFADGFFDGIGWFMEKAVAKPLHHIENLVLGREDIPMNWIYF